MNKKIKELREQALRDVDHLLETEGSDHVVMYREHLDMVNEKFAELIVRRVISVYNDTETFKTSTYDDKRVLDYFGVKE